MFFRLPLPSGFTSNPKLSSLLLDLQVWIIPIFQVNKSTPACAGITSILTLYIYIIGDPPTYVGVREDWVVLCSSPSAQCSPLEAVALSITSAIALRHIADFRKINRQFIMNLASQEIFPMLWCRTNKLISGWSEINQKIRPAISRRKLRVQDRLVEPS